MTRAGHLAAAAALLLVFPASAVLPTAPARAAATNAAPRAALTNAPVSWTEVKAEELDQRGLLPTGKRKKGIALFDTEGSMGFGGWHPREVWALDRKGERSVLLYSDSMDAHLQRPSGPPVWDRVLAEPARVRETATTLLADGWTGTADELLDTARLLAS